MTDNDFRKLTTGQAAAICSVKPDTVLKWVTKGRLRACRTAGGHFRIDYRDIEPFIRAQRPHSPQPPPAVCTPRPLRCWEYMGEPGSVHEDCRRCVVYRSRAAWCFEVLGTAHGGEHKRRHCQTSCEECSYYRRIRGMPTRIVVITRDDALIHSLQSETEASLELHFVRSGYEAAAGIGILRPAFVVVDQAIAAREPDLFEYLTRDVQIAGMRTVLALPASAVAGGSCGTGTVIEKPFGVVRLAGLVRSFPVEVACEDG